MCVCGGGGEKELPAGGIRASQGTFSSMKIKHSLVTIYREIAAHVTVNLVFPTSFFEVGFCF